MYKSENWTTEFELKSVLTDRYEGQHPSGPSLCSIKGMDYTDSSNSSIAVTGASGMGKTLYVTLPFIQDIIDKGENLVVVETKGQCFAAFDGKIPDSYQSYAINLRNPHSSPDRYNPLTVLKSCHSRGFMADRHRLVRFADSLADNLFSDCDTGDEQLLHSAKGLFRAMVYTLVENGSDQQANLPSLQNMLHQLAEDCARKDSAVRLYRCCGSSFVKNSLEGYILCDRQTRRRALAMVNARVDGMLFSPAVSELVRSDSCRFDRFNCEKPFAVFIILPDDCKNSRMISAVATDQLALILEDMATSFGDRLPRRTNIIAEDIALAGGGIPSLPTLAQQGYSRNIRVMYTCHTPYDAKAVFGKKAEQLQSCCGLTVGFSVNCSQTLRQWSAMCGKRTVDICGVVRQVPLADENALRAMACGTALVIMEGRYKFITHLKKPIPGFALGNELAGYCLEDTSQQWPVFDLRCLIAEKMQKLYKKQGEKDKTEDKTRHGSSDDTTDMTEYCDISDEDIFAPGREDCAEDERTDNGSSLDLTDFEIFINNAKRALNDLAEEEREQLEERMHRNMHKSSFVDMIADTTGRQNKNRPQTDSYHPDFVEKIAADIDRRNGGNDDADLYQIRGRTAEHQPKYFVELDDAGANVIKTARIISDQYGYNMLSSVKLLYDMPLLLQCDSKKEADLLALELCAAKAAARVRVKK